MDKPKQISRRLKTWGLEQFGSFVKFARAPGITQQTLNDYTSARILPGIKMQDRLRKVGCDVEWLMTGTPSVVTAQAKGIPPALGWAKYEGKIVTIPRGKEKWEHKEVSKGAGIPYRRGEFFCLEVSTDSLLTAEPTPIYPGDICIFEANRTPKNGEIVAVRLKGNKLLVRVIKHLSQDKVELCPAKKYRIYPSAKVKKSEIAGLGVLKSEVQLINEEKRLFGIKK